MGGGAGINGDGGGWWNEGDESGTGTMEIYGRWCGVMDKLEYKKYNKRWNKRWGIIDTEEEQERWIYCWWHKYGYFGDEVWMVDVEAQEKRISPNNISIYITYGGVNKEEV